MGFWEDILESLLTRSLVSGPLKHFKSEALYCNNVFNTFYFYMMMKCMKGMSLSYRLLCQEGNSTSWTRISGGRRTWIFCGWWVKKCLILSSHHHHFIPVMVLELSKIMTSSACVTKWVCVCALNMCVCACFVRFAAYWLGHVIHRGLWHGQFGCWRRELDNLDLAVFVRRHRPKILSFF